MPIQIAIVDDKPINRQTVKDKLIGHSLIELVFEAKNGIDFLEKLKTISIKPDVVLMDLEMPEMNGIDAISIATAAYPGIKFIVLTVFEENDKIFEAIKAGASGYLLKEDSAIHILDAVTSVYEHNGIPMSPSIARKTLDLLRQVPAHPIIENTEQVYTNSSGLSEREIEILKEMVSGKNYKAIGEKLFISPLTVRKHAAHIYEKLHVSNRTQAINIAQKHKWI
jgi:DNA-binding NarL/FixJ family response regulator